MSDELISVIVPAYNAARHIRRCVESILRQTHQRIELIVVNDCSTDDTGRILEVIADHDERLCVIHLPKNAGIHATRVHGVQAAHGKYLGFVDADDWVAPTMFADLVREAVEGGADIVACGAVTVSPENKVTGSKVRFRRRKVLDDDLLGRFCRLEFGSGVLWNKLYRADLLRPFATLPLGRDVDASEDYIVNVGCFAHAKRVITLPAGHYRYVSQLESASRAGTNARRFARVLRAYVTCLETYAGSLREHFHHLDQLYARQLALGCYSVPSPADLTVCQPELRQCLERLAAVRPEGIYALVHAFDAQAMQRDHRFKTAIRDFFASGKGLLRACQRELRRAPRQFGVSPSRS